MNIFEAMRKGDNILKKNGIKSYKLDSEILMSEVFQKNRIDIILNSNKALSNKEVLLYNNLIEQRSKKKPIAYLIGKKEFWKYEFDVTKDVLIPRPDTEIIIEQTLKLTKNKSSLKILDIGIGSGCILLSILKDRKSFYGTGIDICKKTLDICRINAKKLYLTDRVRLFKSDVDNFNYGKYDLIVSNPPYIKNYLIKYLLEDIKNFEPIIALDGGLNGCKVIEKVIKKSAELLKRNGNLILEIDSKQIYETKKIMQNNNFHRIKVIKDLGGNIRCIIARKD